MSDLPCPPQQLVEALRQQRAVAIVGSGLSIAAGGPTWEELLHGVAASAAETNPTTGSVKSICTALHNAQQGQLLDAASVLKRVLGSEAFSSAVADQVSNRRRIRLRSPLPPPDKATSKDSLFEEVGARTPRDLKPTPAHRMLVQLGFRAILTTNYDYLLDDACRNLEINNRRYTRRDEDLARRIQAPASFLLRLHGEVNRPEQIVLARDEYPDAMFKGAIREHLSVLLRANRPFWIGYGHRDPNFDSLIDQLVSAFEISGGESLSKGPEDVLQARFSSANITPVWLAEYGDVAPFLRMLAEATGTPLVFRVVLRKPWSGETDALTVADGLSAELSSLAGDRVRSWAVEEGSTIIDFESAPATLERLRKRVESGDGAVRDLAKRFQIESFDGASITAGKSRAAEERAGQASGVFVVPKPEVTASALRAPASTRLQSVPGIGGEPNTSVFQILTDATARPFTLLLLRLFLRDEGKPAEGVLDLLERRVQDLHRRRAAERVFSAIADQIVERLAWASAGGGNARPEDVSAVAELIGHALTARPPMSFLKPAHETERRDPRRLIAIWKEAAPGIGGASGREERLLLFERLLEEAARFVVDVEACFPSPDETMLAQQLERLDRQRPDIARNLQSVSQIPLPSRVLSAKAEAPRGIEGRQYEADYRAAVVREQDYLELFGVDLQPESRRHRLTVAYMSLGLSAPVGRPTKPGAAEGESRLATAESVLNQLSVSGNNRLLIRGEAGSGKSTLFRWVAMQAALGVSTGDLSVRQILYSDFGGKTVADLSEWAKTALTSVVKAEVGEQSEKGVGWRDIAAKVLKETRQHVVVTAEQITMPLSWRERVPFLIRLRDCTNGKLPPIPDWPTFGRRGARNAPGGWAESVLREGRGLVLIDGVDEVPPQFRPTVEGQVKALSRAYDSCIFLLSTRPHSVPEGWLADAGFRDADVAPMARNDLAEFIDRWHAAVAEELARVGRPFAEVEEQADALKKELSENPPMARLAYNPLLGAMICALHRDRRARMPESQFELVEALCHMILHRRERESGLDLSLFPKAYLELTYLQKKVLMQGIASEMLSQKTSALRVADAQREIGEGLATMKGGSKSATKEILESLIERSGMIRKKTEDSVDFVHNTFKEFLAAEGFTRAADPRLLSEHLDEPEWENVLLFAAAGSPTAGFLEQLLRPLLDDGTTIKGENARRQRRSTERTIRRRFLAVRLHAVASQVVPSLESAVLEASKTLNRPKTMAHAAALATLGEEALRHVRFVSKLSADAASASVRTLRLIGTGKAVEEMHKYAGDTRESVLSELVQAIEPLSIPAVVAFLTSDAERSWPPAFLSRIRSLAGFEGLTGVRTLNLHGSAIEDLRPLTSMRTLETLLLSDTPVSDAGLSELARPDSALKALTSLNLSGTQVTDAGLRELARPDSALKALTSLILTRTRVTDAGVMELTHPNTGLKELRVLSLWETPTAQASLLAMAVPQTGVSRLRFLIPSRGQVTPEALHAITASNTGLSELTSLDLSFIALTDLHLRELARPDSGLKALASLNLDDAGVTDDVLKEFARPDSGLKALTSLNLDSTKVTDDGMKELARPDSGLRALIHLSLRDTKVTGAGVRSVKERWPGIEVRR